MKFQTSKDFVCVAVLSTLLLAAPTLCHDEEEAQANLTKSTGHISSPGLDRIKLLALGKQTAPVKQSTSERNPLEESSSKTSGEPKADNKSGNLTSIHDSNESDEIHVEEKRVESRSNSSSSESGFVPSNHFLFADHQSENAQGAHAPVLSKRNSSVDDSVEKHQLHQSLSDDSDDSFLVAPPLIRRPGSPQKEGDSVIVSSDSVPVRVPPKVDNGPNPSIGFRKPIPVIRQETAQLPSSEDNGHI
ncbi:unnamed protein product [Orchesella dallaii]|uniref:Uncharacterized protein n=1 Tax=Orchesella dallaii TaxID=48710 RepID=A0ABP1QA94_9HEXA